MQSKPTFILPVLHPVKALAFNHNGQLLAFGDSEGSIKILDVRSQASVANWSVPKNHDVLGLSFSFDETVMTSVTSDGKLAQWSLRSGHAMLSECSASSKDIPIDPR